MFSSVQACARGVKAQQALDQRGSGLRWGRGNGCQIGCGYPSLSPRGAEERSHSLWGKTWRGFTEKVISETSAEWAQTGRRHSGKAESEQRHGGGKAQDVPRALWESRRASDISLKLWGVTDWMFLFFHWLHSPGDPGPHKKFPTAGFAWSWPQEAK